MEHFIEDRILGKFHNQVPLVRELVVPEQMPTHGLDVAPRYKAVYDAKFENYIWYDDDPHLYFAWFLNGLRLPMISCTTVLGAWEKPFDENMAERCARKDMYEANCLDTTNWASMSIFDRTMAIKKAWKDNSKQATDYGTFAHAVMEGIVLWQNGLEKYCHVDQIYDEMCDRYNEDHEIVRTMSRNFVTNILEELVSPNIQLIAEPLVYDMEAMLAGQSDLVVLDHKEKVIRILDFKTNKRKPGTDTVYNKMEGQLSQLDDVALNHYCIQLCLYQKLVQNILPDYKLGINTILWLDRDTGDIVPIDINPLDWEPIIDYIISELKLIKGKIYELYKA